MLKKSTAQKQSGSSEKSTLALEFKDSKVKDRSDVFLNGEKIGDVGTNLIGIINEYFELYARMATFIHEHHPEELDKDYEIDKLHALITEQKDHTINVVLYQIGRKAFNGFKAVIRESDYAKKVSLTTENLDVVKEHIFMLLGKTVKLHDKNIPNLQHFAVKLVAISGHLETFKPTGPLAIFGPVITLMCNQKAKDAKLVSNAFDGAVQFYKKPSLYKIATLDESKKQVKETAKSEKKQEKQDKQDLKKEKKKTVVADKKNVPVEPKKKTVVTDKKADGKNVEEEKSSSEEKGFW